MNNYPTLKETNELIETVRLKGLHGNHQIKMSLILRVNKLEYAQLKHYTKDLKQPKALTVKFNSTINENRLEMVSAYSGFDYEKPSTEVTSYKFVKRVKANPHGPVSKLLEEANEKEAMPVMSLTSIPLLINGQNSKTSRLNVLFTDIEDESFLLSTDGTIDVWVHIESLQKDYKETLSAIVDILYNEHDLMTKAITTLFLLNSFNREVSWSAVENPLGKDRNETLIYAGVQPLPHYEIWLEKYKELLGNEVLNLLKHLDEVSKRCQISVEDLVDQLSNKCKKEIK